jgi:phosphoserine phosphatase
MTWNLVTLDLDGTLLPEDTVFAAVLRENGHATEVAASDARYFAGELTLEACFWEQWELVERLSLAEMHRALRRATWLPGIAAGVQALQAEGARVCLLTDQPSVLTDFLGRWGLTDAICSPVTVRDGRPVEIDARFDKWDNLRRRLAEWDLDPARVCHVGNGDNDVPVWQHVGASVAAFAPAPVAAQARLDVGRPASMLAIADAVLRLADAPA